VNWLFIHQNFPGQFVHAARHLAAAGDQVVFITQARDRELQGVRKIVYAPPRRATGAHPYVQEFNTAIETGLAVAGVCEELKRTGFTPDLVVGHNGWGEILYIKDCWPTVPLLGYFEFFYHAQGGDLDFDPEFPPSTSDRMRIRTRNAVNLLGLESADVVAFNEVLQQIVRVNGQTASTNPREAEAIEFSGATFRPHQNLMQSADGKAVRLTTAESLLLAHFVANPWGDPDAQRARRSPLRQAPTGDRSGDRCRRQPTAHQIAVDWRNNRTFDKNGVSPGLPLCLRHVDRTLSGNVRMMNRGGLASGPASGASTADVDRRCVGMPGRGK
jgi:hypothetical protein